MTFNTKSGHAVGMTLKRIFASKREAGNNVGMRKNCTVEILKTCIIHLEVLR
jgi:hypothetical protein